MFSTVELNKTMPSSPTTTYECNNPKNNRIASCSVLNIQNV